jgi:hypothetical protein
MERTVLGSASPYPDQTFEWLNKVCIDQTSSLIYLKVDRAYDNVRAFPQFTDLVRKMNL